MRAVPAPGALRAGAPRAEFGCLGGDGSEWASSSLLDSNLHHRYHARAQNAQKTLIANSVAENALKRAGTHGTCAVFLDLFNLTANDELVHDTHDGTHFGWRANALKVQRMFDALACIHRVQSRSARAESTATQIKSSM